MACLIVDCHTNSEVDYVMPGMKSVEGAGGASHAGGAAMRAQGSDSQLVGANSMVSTISRNSDKSRNPSGATFWAYACCFDLPGAMRSWH